MKKSVWIIAGIVGMSLALWASENGSSFFAGAMVPQSYTVTQGQVSVRNRVFRLLRVMVVNDRKYFLAVDEDLLTTVLLSSSEGITPTNVSRTPYARLVGRILPLPQRKGRVSNRFHGLVLTADHCPTPRLMSREYYDILKKALSQGKRIPVVVFFSGRWIETHQDDLAWLKTCGLPIVAGNHTFAHHIVSNHWERDAFVAEITNTEVVMLSHGIMPSIWFRFPGLAYHPDQLTVLRELGLVAVGTTMWIGQKTLPESGIILSHANGTQPAEVRHLRRLVTTNSQALREGRLRFVEIGEYARSLSEEGDEAFAENRQSLP